MRYLTALICLFLAVAGPISAAPADLGGVRFAWSPGPDVPQVALSLDTNLWNKQGLVRGPEPSQALLRSYFATEPLRSLAPKNVTLK